MPTASELAVILPLEEYEELLEDLHITRVAEETKDDERIPWNNPIEHKTQI
jgi:hypothetical protein